jgi:hypothetical protein
MGKNQKLENPIWLSVPEHISSELHPGQRETILCV